MRHREVNILPKVTQLGSLRPGTYSNLFFTGNYNLKLLGTNIMYQQRLRKILRGKGKSRQDFRNKREGEGAGKVLEAKGVM